MAVDIQIAFQGGGARIAALLAAVEAIQEAEARDVVRVTRVSGASAGAIAAAVLSSRIPAARIRKRIQDKFGDPVLAKMFPPVSKTKASWNLYWQKPFYDRNILRKILEHLFDSESGDPILGDRCIKNNTTFADFEIDCYCTITSLLQEKPIVHGGKSDTTNIVINSILDSSTIPFVFRSKINDIEHTLDGGICENLPTEPLLMDKEKYGDVVVMSFEKSKNSLPNGTLKLAETILDIMINHTVERAVSGLPHDSVCRIPTSLKTLDFSRVCSIGMSDPAYDLAKKSVSSWIRDWVDRSSTRAIGINVGEYQKNVKTISDAYQKEFLIHRSALIVVARSLGNGMGQFDDVFSLTDIEPLQEGMLVHREFLGRADGSSDNTDWSVRSMNGVSVGPSIPVTILPGKGEAPGHLDACLFFESPLKLNKIYRVEAKSRTRNAFEKLRTAGADYLSNTLERKNTKALAFDLVLAVPDKTVLSMDAGGRGHELTEQEMVDSLYKNLIPGGFRAYGWRAENMVQGETLRVDYRRK